MGADLNALIRHFGIEQHVTGVLAREELAHRVLCQDGTGALRAAGPLAFLYLDSSDNPMDTLEQFQAATLLPGAIVVVDDAQPMAGRPHGKASLLMPVLAKQGCALEFVPTERGYLALVCQLPAGKAAGTPSLAPALEGSAS